MHQFKSFAVAASFLASTGFAQQSAWGQCGGIGWTGATTCVSGYTCVKSNDYYSQCVPGTASTSAAASSTSKPATTLKTTTTNVQTSAPASTATGTPTTGAGAGTTLQSGYYWIRAVESPYFHYYLQSEQLYSTGTGVLGSYTTAGQFQVVDGQLVQLISAPGAATQLLYGIVSQTASFDGRALAVSFSTSKNTYGTWGWQGDGLTWSTPNITRPNAIAWYVCGDNHAVYLNLGAYLYNTPTGCTDETIHYYNDSVANSKRDAEKAGTGKEE